MRIFFYLLVMRVVTGCPMNRGRSAEETIYLGLPRFRSDTEPRGHKTPMEILSYYLQFPRTAATLNLKNLFTPPMSLSHRMKP